MHASLLGFSLEGIIIDNDIIGATQRTIKGIEVTEGSRAVHPRHVCLVCIENRETLTGAPSALLHGKLFERVEA